MLKMSGNQEKRKLKKLERTIKEVLLLSGGDPTAMDNTTVTGIGHSSDDKDIPLGLRRKLQTMRNLKDPPRIKLSLNRLNGARIGSRNIAELVHYVAFHHVDKPLWVSLRPNRGILQTVVFRVNSDLEMVESNKNGTYIGELFGSESFIRMQTEVWNNTDFWTSMLNVPISKFERLKRVLSHADILKKHIKSDVMSEIMVTLRQMIDFCYPFPRTSNECVEGSALPPIIPTKEKYATVTADSPMFAIDCEMCTTVTGESELTRISIINDNYEVLLDTLVKPRNRIVDYVTKYSGITKEMLENVDVRVEDVQKALSHILPNDAILVGHTLECDFSAMRITHPYCVDISLCLNLSGTERQRTSLKTLARIFLDEEIQGENGHCSVDDAIVTMRLLKYKLSQGARFGNVSLGWKFDDWAHENGLTSSGVRIKRDKDAAEIISDREPPSKKRCINEITTQTCERCSRPLSVPCIVPNCGCKTNIVKNCVICCLNAVPPQSSSEEPTLIWSDAFQGCCVGEFDPIYYHLQLNKDKTAFYAIPGSIGINTCSKLEVYVNSDEFDSLDELADRVSAEVISHNIAMMDIDIRRVKMKTDEVPLFAVDNAIRKVISYASLNSLIILVLSSPQESICYLTMKTRSKRDDSWGDSV